MDNDNNLSSFNYIEHCRQKEVSEESFLTVISFFVQGI